MGVDMGQYAQTTNIVGGRIRAVCPRCGKTAYLEVASGSRLRVFRCTCGKSTPYSINYRKEKRETTYGPGKVVLRNAEERKIRLCDASNNGVSFFVTSESALSLRRGQEISVKFRAGSSMVQRKICVRNINKTRIGAQYVRSGISL